MLGTQLAAVLHVPNGAALCQCELLVPRMPVHALRGVDAKAWLGIGPGLLLLQPLEAVDVGDVQELFHAICEEEPPVVHIADVRREALADLQLLPSGPGVRSPLL